MESAGLPAHETLNYYAQEYARGEGKTARRWAKTVEHLAFPRSGVNDRDCHRLWEANLFSTDSTASIIDLAAFGTVAAHQAYDVTHGKR